MDVYVFPNDSTFADDVTESQGVSMKAKLTLIWAFVGLSVVGGIGNCCSILLLLGKKQRRKKILSNTYRIYIIALAIADNGMLLFTGILRYAVISWIYETNQPSWVYEVHLCRWHRFFMHASHNAAVWLLVVMAIDRFVAVCFPFRYREVKHNSKKAVQVTVVVFVLSFVCATPFLAVGPLYVKDEEHRKLPKYSEQHPKFFNDSVIYLGDKRLFENQWVGAKNLTEISINNSTNAWNAQSDVTTPIVMESSHTNFTNSPDPGTTRIACGCSLTATLAEKYAYMINIIFHVLLAFLVPYFVLIILNVVIFRCLHYPNNATPLSGARQRLHRRITVMMLAVCCTFIVLWLPQAFLLMSSSDAHSQNCNDEEVLHSLAALCGLSNSALNFVLYCMTVKKFRNEAWRSIQSICCFLNVKQTLSDIPSNNDMGMSISKMRSSLVTYNGEGSALTEFVSKSYSRTKSKPWSKELKRLNIIPEQDVEFSRCGEEISQAEKQSCTTPDSKHLI